MSDELETLLESLKELEDRTGMVGWLVDETLRYRDELAGRGVRLTVDDTRRALDGLEGLLKSRADSPELTNVQSTLLDRWKKHVDQMS